MLKHIDPSPLCPPGYQVVQCQVFADASSIGLQLDCAGNRVCGSLVAGRWSFHVPQNKLGTARMSPQQHQAIKSFAQAVHAAVGDDWHRRHAAPYETNA